MRSSSAIREQIEAALSHRIPSALTVKPRSIRPVVATGVSELDALLGGGMPVGAITELTGNECSGRTSVAHSFLAKVTGSGHVCAWVDVCNSLDPESAAAAGVDLKRLLWVRCGVVREQEPRSAESFRIPEKYLTSPEIKKGLHGGGFGPHPRTEGKGITAAISELLQPTRHTSRSAEVQSRPKLEREAVTRVRAETAATMRLPDRVEKPWKRLEQALRATDLLLQAGGFAAVVLDMAGLAPEYASTVPLATWFRYRAAVERTQACLLLLTQCPCAKSSSELLLQLESEEPLGSEPTVFTGMKHRAEIQRLRFAQTTAKVTSLRKPPQRENNSHWHTQCTWAGQ